LPCQHRADVAGEACHRSQQRDFHRLDGVALHMISLADVSGKSGVISAGRLQREWGVLGKVSAGGFSQLDVAYGSFAPEKFKPRTAVCPLLPR
jgi:hypothetical protein